MNKENIVIIRLDAIGDFILWLDAAHHLRSIFPDKKITLLANSAWAELARELPYFDHVIDINTNRYKGRLRLIKSLMGDFLHFRRWSANIVLHPVQSRSLHSNLIARWIKSPKKIAPSGDANNLNKHINKLPGFSYQATLKWYSKIVSIEKNQMELISNAQFMSALAGIPIEPQLPNLSFLLQSDKYKKTPLPTPYIVIVPGASDIKKAWPIAYFAQIIESIPDHHTIVICGSQSEENITEKLTHTLKNENKKVINLGGKTTLKDLVSIIFHAKGVIGNDSAAIHISAAVGVPSTAILGGGHFGRFLPYFTNSELPHYAPKVVYYPMPCYGCNWICPFIKSHMKTWPCIAAISTDAIQKERFI